MKTASLGSRRPLRWVVLLLLAAGIAFAADSTWFGFVSSSLRASHDWISTVYEVEAPAADIAQPANPGIAARGADLSMTRLLNGLLFSPPTSTWRLESAAPKSDFAWLTQQESAAVMDPISSPYSSRSVFSSPTVGYQAANMGPLPLDPNGGPTTTGTWISNASGNWGTSTNWHNGTIPQGNTAAARFDTLNITTDVTVTNEVPRTIGRIDVGDTDFSNHYNIAGATLTLENTFDGQGTLIQTVTSAGDTISAPLLLNQDLRVENYSTNVFTLAGSITSNATPPTSTVINFYSGSVNVTGNLNNGTGTALGINVHAGQVVLSGTNSYTRQTYVSGGTLLVNGDNSASTGTVFVSGEGSVLGGTGTIGGNTFISGEAIITGGTTETVGTLTLLGDLSMSNEGTRGYYVADLGGTTSDLLAVGGELILGNGSYLKITGSGSGSTYVLATFSSLIDTFTYVEGIPANYALVYNPTDIELVPVPEPATWIGAAMGALGALAFAKRKRRKS